MTDGHGERRALRTALKGVLGAGLLALFAVPGGPAQAAWDGEQNIVLGDRVAAEFAESPGAEMHHYGFYAPELATISARFGRSPVQAVVGVFGGYLADTDNVDVRAASAVTNYTVPRRGFYEFRVSSIQGRGEYRMQTRVVFNRRPLSGTVTPATEVKSGSTVIGYRGTYKFGALAGSRISGGVRGTTVAPQIESITAPSGAVLPAKMSHPKGRAFPANTTAFRNVVLNETGEYMITVFSTVKEAVNWSHFVASPRPRGRSFVFPAMESPRGDVATIREQWLESGHGDPGEEAFKHWTGAVPDVVPTGCARCHSTPGYVEGVTAYNPATVYTATSTVNPYPVATAPRIGGSVECAACHTPAAQALTSVIFPSGQKVTGLGDEARCMVCHQGRESVKSVEAAITTAAAANDDTVPERSGTDTTSKLSFRNVHYFAAGATMYGRQAEGAYEYADPAYATATTTDPVTGLKRRMPYDRKFAHVSGYDTCIDCHDPHTLERKIEECADCHVRADGADVASDHDLHDIRMAGTTEDYDGDGNTAEGVYYEIETLSNHLYAAIQAYAKKADPGFPNRWIAYDSHAYPYFFVDANTNGVKDATDTTGYNRFTPRLLRACYNYQYVQKDPGAFAHNSKYVVQILYDSIADLNNVAGVTSLVGTAGPLHRNDETHFNSSAEAYRDWDTAGLDGSTPASCSRCHSVEGFRYHIANQAERNQPFNAALTSGMTCESCHKDGVNFKEDPATVYVAKVVFPYVDQSTSTSSSTATPSTGSAIAGVTISNSPDPTVTPGKTPPDKGFICMTCHQGRNSKVTYDGYLATSFAVANPQRLRFQNVHYLIAGATQYSTKANVYYPWTAVADELGTPFPATRTYQTPWTHTAEQAWVAYSSGTDTGGMPTTAQCTFCHMQEGSHRFEPEAGETCTEYCHITVGGTAQVANDVSTWRKGQAINGGSAMTTDFDGDAATVKLADEVAAFNAALYKALNDYARLTNNPNPLARGFLTPKNWLVYDAHTNPYWYTDVDGNGTMDDIHSSSTATPNNTGPDGKVDSSDAYDQFNRFMLFGAHNYQCVSKDPGAWAHNGRFVMQILYDSIDYLDDGLWNGSPRNATNGALLVRPVRTY